MYRLILLLGLLATLTVTVSAQQPIVGQPCGAAGVSSIATSGQAVQCQGSPLTWVATGGGGGGAGTVTHSAGPLTLNDFILGNGSADIQDAGFSVVPPSTGGTGVGNPTAHGIAIAEGVGNYNFACTTALTSQIFSIVNGSDPVCKSPGVSDGNGAAHVTTTPYVVGCDSATSVLDRATTIVFDAGASVITAPDHTAAGCGSSMTFTLINESGSTLTVNRSGTDTFNVTGNVAKSIAATSFTIPDSANVTLNNGEAGIWNARVLQPGAGSPALSSVTAATTTATINSVNNPIVWNWAQTTASQTAFTFGENTAATGSGDIELAASTLSASTAIPFAVTQGSITGGTAIPALQITTAWNGAAVNKALVVNVTNTATGGGSHIIDLNAGAAGATSEFSVDSAGNETLNGTLLINGVGVTAKAAANPLVFQGGVDNGATLVGSATFRGADNNSTVVSSGGGAATLRGGDETGSTANQEGGGNVTVRGGNVTLSTTSASTGGNVTITGGACNAVASANTCPGVVKIIQPYFSTGTAAVNDLACVTAANTVASCTATGTGQFVGVIDSSSTNQVFVAAIGAGGTHTFNATSATFTNGHFVCQSTVASAGNLVVDSSTACAVGLGVGIYIGATGTQTAPLVWMKPS